jgi:protein phosphatase 2C family protein 2/3
MSFLRGAALYPSFTRSAGVTLCADYTVAEFRGPGMHHRFDDSPDDYEMDMDQRTRMLGRGGRIILLGDGTEILTGQSSDHDGDIDMEDRVTEVEDDSSEDRDEEAMQRNIQAQKNGQEERQERGETPAPAGTNVSQKVKDGIQRLADSKPEDLLTKGVADSISSSDKIAPPQSKAGSGADAHKDEDSKTK